MGRDLRHADRAHRGEIGVEIAREQGFGFVDRAAVKHLDKTLVAAVAEPVARRQEDERGERNVIGDAALRSEEHTSELQSLMRISYAVFCLKKKKQKANITKAHT